MKNYLLICSGALLILACNQKSENIENENSGSMIEAEGQNSEEIKAENERILREEAEKKKYEAENVTTLKFDKLVHNFGKVKADTDNFTTFKVTNTGTKPLIITNVEASCGCTTPKKPENPILPGQSDVIDVKFHPNAGQGEVKKTVTVTANTDPKLSELQITASVQD